MDSLYPGRDIQETPWFLSQAISHALQVLGFMELGDDQPPEEIWLDQEALSAHFDSVREKWAAGSSGDAVQDAPMTENELAKEWRR